MCGLGAEGAFESAGFLGGFVRWGGRVGGGRRRRGDGQGIAEETEGEDCEGEGVAGSLGVAVEETG